MERYNQAPKITNTGKPKNEGSFLSMPWNVFTAINEKIDSRHSTARLLMILLVGSGDGFRLAEKTALDRLSCGKDAYHDARKYLAKLGLITNDKSNNEIVIHYEALLSRSETYSTKEKGRSETYSCSSSETYSNGRSENYYNIIGIEKEYINSDKPKRVGQSLKEPEEEVITINLTKEELKAARTISKKVLEHDYKTSDYEWIDNDYIKSIATKQIFRVLH